ncbi:MAG TPA: CapA family protein [Candidatus Paceibacterota bacterium]
MGKIPVFLTLFTFSLLLLAGAALFGKANPPAGKEIPQVLIAPAVLIQEKIENKLQNHITLLFVGDVLLDRGIPWAIYTYGADNWQWPFLPIADTLSQADLLFGNLESQISDKGTNVGSIYSFRAHPNSIETLQYGSFDVVSVANNHSFDYTREAFEDSRARLQQAGITPVAGELVIKEVRGTYIGFLAYSNFPGPSTVTWGNLNNVAAHIARAKSNVDILAVSLHAGEEYIAEPNDFQKAFSKQAIDAGADLLIGHHPHVLQPLEQYNRGWIIYSLGNFLFDQNFSAETMQGAILKVVVENKKIKEVTLLPTRINSMFQVELAD